MPDLTVILYNAEPKAEEARGARFRQASERDGDSPRGGSHMVDERKATTPAEPVEAARRSDV